MTTLVEVAPSAPDEPGRLLTLTEAATHSGYSREALRLRVRRGKLPAVRGNDRVVRIKASDLADLPPVSTDDQEDAEPATPDDRVDTYLEVQQHRGEAVRARLEAARIDLKGLRDRLDEERELSAERATQVAVAEARYQAAIQAQQVATEARQRAEARLAVIEEELREARRPLWERVIRAIRG
ncbi:helix-turn-helix domain-containing protein (plasmid) [Pararoseomonas sp. SCSIO 73927]|uniref:helix-turn-helix domain-containing protein n=1 Tax=Pararoseomonas sp. SCSIO 73927 TaxID=3114537 RepID=UPI0030CB57ED